MVDDGTYGGDGCDGDADGDDDPSTQMVRLMVRHRGRSPHVRGQKRERMRRTDMERRSPHDSFARLPEYLYTRSTGSTSVRASPQLTESMSSSIGIGLTATFSDSAFCQSHSRTKAAASRRVSWVTLPKALLFDLPCVISASGP
jgi:hypothetical protein